MGRVGGCGMGRGELKHDIKLQPIILKFNKNTFNLVLILDFNSAVAPSALILSIGSVDMGYVWVFAFREFS